LKLRSPPDPDGFSEQLVAMMPRLHRFCIALAGGRDGGEDLKQEVLERALLKQQLFQPGTRLDHWLFRLARNLHIDRIRAAHSRMGQAGRQAESLELAEHVVGSDGREVLEQRSELSHATRAFMQLPETMREVFSLVVLEGMSYREAAELLEVPIGTIMSRIARARTALERSVHGLPANQEHPDDR